MSTDSLFTMEVKAININFCPFCGTKLPESKRDLWFDTLESMGFDDPITQDIPHSFKSNAWHQQVDGKSTDD